MRMGGFFKIDHFDKDGILIETVETPNAMMTRGMQEVCELIMSDTTSTGTAFDYIAVGTGTTAATTAQTALITEITENGLARSDGGGAGCTGTNITTTLAYDTCQLVASYSAGSSYAVTESGVLNAASAGQLLCRQTFSAINVTTGDTLTITWKVKLADISP